jgi:cell division protein FtsB
MSPFAARRRWIAAAFAAVALLWCFFIVFGERGLWHLWRLGREKRALDDLNFLLRRENDALREKIERIRRDDAYLEKIAREELGLVRPGEIVYRFAAPQTPPEPLTAAPSEPPPSSERTRPR